MNSALSTLLGLGSLALLVACPGCKAVDKILSLDFVDLPDSRIENLERLHTPSGKHRYAAQFVGDFEYSYMRSGRTVGGLRIGKPASGDPSPNAPTALPDPSEKCYELLEELLGFDASENPRLASQQIAWCARVIQKDPSPLSRELATLALGAHGRRVGIDGPTFLPLDLPRADADQTAELLTAVISTWRALRDGQGLERELERSLTELRETTFDLDGARRVLPALAGLLAGAEPGAPGYAPLLEVLVDFQQRTIELALYVAYDRRQPSSRVRAAAVNASVEAGGAPLLARFVGSTLAAERRRGRDRDVELVAEILRLVAEVGLPEQLEGIEDAEYAQLRESWLGLLVAYAVEDPESYVRVKAMQALGAITDGPGSLREEEWEEWHYARTLRRREEAGLPRALDAVEDPAEAGDTAEPGGADDAEGAGS